MKHFIRHYLEMVAAMFVGMGVLGMPAGMLGRSSEAGELLVMGASMTIPMVAWMRYRGHSWAIAGEMSGAMLVPTAVAIALLGSVEYGTLMVFEHVGDAARHARRDAAAPSEYLHRHTLRLSIMCQVRGRPDDSAPPRCSTSTDPTGPTASSPRSATCSPTRRPTRSRPRSSPSRRAGWSAG